MVGCHRVRSRRLVRVLGTAFAVTAAVLCFGARLAPPVVRVEAYEAPEHPRPSGTPLPTPTARPSPTPEATPTPAPTPVASPPATAEPTPGRPTAAPVVAPPSGAVSPPPPTPAPTHPPTPASTQRSLATPQATPSLVTQLRALPAAVAEYAQDSQGNTSPYVVGADAMAGVAVTSSLALATLRRRGLL